MLGALHETRFILKGFAPCRQPLKLYRSQYVCRGAFFEGTSRTSFCIIDFGGPSEALEDLGSSLQHSKQHKFGNLGIEAHRDGQDGVLEASRVDSGAHFG